MQLDLPLGAATNPLPPLAPGTDDRSPVDSSSAPGTVHVVLRPSGIFEFIRHPRARRYIIRVRPNGTVRVTIPRGGSKREGQDFARQHAPWVEKQLERLARDNAQPGSVSPLLDRDVLDRGALERAKSELPPRLLELASLHGLRVTRVSVRNQRWRWGSCSRTGHICLNWRLVQMPPFVRDYVMIHELMHLKRMDHSPRFWKLVAAACPDYAAARAWLRQHARS